MTLDDTFLKTVTFFVEVEVAGPKNLSRGMPSQGVVIVVGPKLSMVS
jgi:hypothetical protein